MLEVSKLVQLRMKPAQLHAAGMPGLYIAVPTVGAPVNRPVFGSSRNAVL
jgi:hypothetical protein